MRWRPACGPVLFRGGVCGVERAGGDSRDAAVGARGPARGVGGLHRENGARHLGKAGGNGGGAAGGGVGGVARDVSGDVRAVAATPGVASGLAEIEEEPAGAEEPSAKENLRPVESPRLDQATARREAEMRRATRNCSQIVYLVGDLDRGSSAKPDLTVSCGKMATCAVVIASPTNSATN